MKIIISAIQFEPKVGDLEGNLKKAGILAKQARGEGVKIAVLPEICDVGYDPKQIHKLATSFPNNATEGFANIACENSMILLVGMAEKRGDNFFNTSVLFDSNGKIVAQYDKSHLCPIAPFNEPAIFKPGSEFITKKVEGVTLGLSICYDIRFPEIYRKLMSMGAQVVLHPTAFPKIRTAQFEMYASVRAMENQFFFAAANGCGNPAGIELGGNSIIAGPTGEILARAPTNTEAAITAEIDLSDIEKIRREFPVISQRRPEIY